jgi:hypothetical protein
VDGDRDLAELVTVLARVVGAEEEVSATSELDTEVGLGTTTVTTVQRREWRARGNCSGHEASFSFLGVLLKVTQGSKSGSVRPCSPGSTSKHARRFPAADGFYPVRPGDLSHMPFVVESDAAWPSS